MFDIGWPELFIIAVAVLLVVGPKDLPKVLRTVGHLAGKAKAITREFRGHVDDMIRDSELEDVRDQINSAGESSLEALKENVIHPNEIEGIEYLEDDWPNDEDVPSSANSDPIEFHRAGVPRWFQVQCCVDVRGKSNNVP